MNYSTRANPVASKLAKIRDEIAKVESDLDDVKAAPLSHDEAVSALRAVLTGGALEHAEPLVREIAARGASGGAHEIAARPVSMQTLAHLLGPDNIVAAVSPWLKSVCKTGMGAAERAEKAQALADRRAKLLVDEERECVRIEAETDCVVERDDERFDPATALAVWAAA